MGGESVSVTTVRLLACLPTYLPLCAWASMFGLPGTTAPAWKTDVDLLGLNSLTMVSSLYLIDISIVEFRALGICLVV